MKFISLGSAVFLISLSLSAKSADTAVKVERVSESRTKSINKDLQYISSDGVDLAIVLEGSAVKAAVKYGNIKILEAIDDVGTDIKVRKDGFSEIPESLRSKTGEKPEFERVRNYFGQGKPGDVARIEVKLGMPARKATKISKLKAEVQLQCGGDRKILKISKLQSLNGKNVDDPVLKAAGLIMKVNYVKLSNELEIEYKGNLETLGELEFEEAPVVDAKGERASTGFSGSTSNGTSTVTYFLSKPLDDALILQVAVVTGLKTVTVPFELKDIELP